MGTQSNCDLLPNLQTSDAIDLETCNEIGKYGYGNDVVYLFRVLNQTKTGDVRVVLQGSGIDCSPVNGALMTAISTSGNALYCKAFVGHLTTLGNITCTYSCNCWSGCVMFRVTITNPSDKVVYAFVV